MASETGSTLVDVFKDSCESLGVTHVGHLTLLVENLPSSSEHRVEVILPESDGDPRTHEEHLALGCVAQALLVASRERPGLVKSFEDILEDPNVVSAVLSDAGVAELEAGIPFAQILEVAA